MQNDEQNVDVLDAPATALQLRRPDVPTTLGELAALKGEAIEVVEARVQILETLRKAAIRQTMPEDWLLFKAPTESGGQIVGYLQDCGADRVRDLYGIRIYNVSKPEKIQSNDPAVFHYVVTGDGVCTLTKQIVENMEGGRSSTDDFCRDKTGADLELAVRKAARANLDGGITRELAAMKNVPLLELEAAWTGTTKTVDRCRRGRGFGTHDERLGATSAKAPDVEPPVCPHCGATGAYRAAKGNRGAFYGCPNYTKHADKKWIQDVDKWLAAHPPKPANGNTTTPPVNPTTPPPATKVTRDLTADEVFPTGRNREPGQEG